MFESLRLRFAAAIAPELRGVPTVGSATVGIAHAAPTMAGPVVNEKTALGITPIWRAVNLYANTIAAMPLTIAERDERGGARPAINHPAYDLLRSRPNDRSTSFKFRQALIGHALTFGNGYAQINWDGKGRRALSLDLLDPRNVEPFAKAGGSLGYRDRSTGDEAYAEDIIHISGFGWDGVSGYSPITIARETLGVAVAQRDYEAGIYGNSARASGHVEIPGSMNTKQQGEFRENWNAVHQGTANAGKVGILTGGARWVQTSFSPADAQLILTKGFSVAEVARLFGIPLHMLNQMDSATLNNVEHQGLEFLTYSITPWLESIEGELDVKLLGPQERRRFFAHHDVRTLTRGDMAARTAYNRGLFDMGAKSINEIRLDEGLNPLEEPRADMHWIPVNNLAAIEAMGDGPTQPPASIPDGGES